MTKEKKCPVCGKIFGTEGKARKTYCSVECREKHYAKVKKSKLYFQCEYCGTPFKEGSTNPYCSDECQNMYSSGRVKNTGRKKKALSIVDISKRAKAEGMTYGQYVVKYGL